MTGTAEPVGSVARCGGCPCGHEPASWSSGIAKIAAGPDTSTPPESGWISRSGELVGTLDFVDDFLTLHVIEFVDCITRGKSAERPESYPRLFCNKILSASRAAQSSFFGVVII